MNPLKDTEYEYRNRNEIQTTANFPARAIKEGWQRVNEPLGSFGIVAKGAKDITTVNGKPEVNYILGFDTKYPDANGVLRKSQVPQWVFNRDAIKQRNNDSIDKIANILLHNDDFQFNKQLLSSTEDIKKLQSVRVDKIATGMENLLNAVEPTSIKNKINKTIANVAESIPYTLGNKAGKIIKTGGKAARVLGDALAIANVGITAVEDYMDDGVFGKETVKETVGLAGDITGSVLGAKIGATIFGTIGGIASSGALTAPLAAVGGVIGGYLGVLWGEELSEDVFGFLTS